MPASMRAWCEGELKKITGKEDTTLVEFCYTLDSAADIREYMRNYMVCPRGAAGHLSYIRIPAVH